MTSLICRRSRETQPFPLAIVPEGHSQAPRLLRFMGGVHCACGLTQLLPLRSVPAGHTHTPGVAP